MKSIIFLLLKVLIQILIWCVFPFRYLISRIIYLLLFRLFGYRTKVVEENLRNSFPEKSLTERNTITKMYYRNLSDIMVETVMQLVLPKAFIKKRCVINPESLRLLTEMHKNKKSCLLVLGHMGNWEWAGAAVALAIPQQFNVIYRPLKNSFSNYLIGHLRKRFGMEILSMKESYRIMAKQRNEITATAFIADQSPPPENALWLNFLNQDTPVFKGPEVISRKLNLPVLYGSVYRVKPGFYEVNVEVITTEPNNLIEGDITRFYFKKLEKDIQTNPSLWLWSHKRWKHKRKINTI